MSSPGSSGDRRIQRRFPSGSNLPARLCGDICPDDDELVCRRPEGHDGSHRVRAWTWGDPEDGPLVPLEGEAAAEVEARGLEAELLPVAWSRPGAGDDPLERDPSADYRPELIEVYPPPGRQLAELYNRADRGAIAGRDPRLDGPVVFRSREWDGPPPAAGDVIVATWGAYVVLEVALGAGAGMYRIVAAAARLIAWTGSRPSPA